MQLPSPENRGEKLVSRRAAGNMEFWKVRVSKYFENMKSSLLTGQRGNWSPEREENWPNVKFWVSGRTRPGGDSSYSPELVVGLLALSRANQELNRLIKTPKRKPRKQSPRGFQPQDPGSVSLQGFGLACWPFDYNQATWEAADMEL